MIITQLNWEFNYAMMSIFVPNTVSPHEFPFQEDSTFPAQFQKP